LRLTSRDAGERDFQQRENTVLNPSNTVREFAVQIPNAVRLFERLGIDYCCGGGKSLSEACVNAKLAVDEVLHDLADERPEKSSSDWTQASLSDLVDHIISRHHVYVKQELPRIAQLLEKVAGKHSEKYPELKELKTLFRAVNQELSSHLMKEETVLFPYVVELERMLQESQRLRPPMFGSVKNPIHMMELEHDSAGDVLKQMREVTGGFTPPENGCFSFQTLYQGLQEFEADLHQHIHLENNILFPRAIALEERGR
jgi:regulator of cell morphogenesis and NO signaling